MEQRGEGGFVGRRRTAGGESEVGKWGKKNERVRLDKIGMKEEKKV